LELDEREISEIESDLKWVEINHDPIFKDLCEEPNLKIVIHKL
jgi:hypothetical protein